MDDHSVSPYKIASGTLDNSESKDLRMNRAL